MSDVVVVGAGVIGSAGALELARAGARVTLVDPDPGHGASYAAAGMLAPVTEAHFGEESLLALNLAGARAWPAFAESLAAESPAPVGLSRAGTVVVAHDADDRRALRRLEGYQRELGLEVSSLTSREVRELEPLLAPDVAGGAVVVGDHSVDNRVLLAALQAALAGRGVRQVGRAVTTVLVEGARATGVRLDDGSEIAADAVVLAAGVGTPAIAEGALQDQLALPVRPVQGQILRLKCTPDTGPVLSRTLRALVRGSSVYLVPRADGEVVVGATTEERGPVAQVTAGGIWELLRDARAVLPVVAELAFVQAWAGLRPASPDNLPLVGPGGPAGLVLATGHGRNGILLAPLTAAAVVDAVAGRSLDPVWDPAHPNRFGALPALAHP